MFRKATKEEKEQIALEMKQLKEANKKPVEENKEEEKKEEVK